MDSSPHQSHRGKLQADEKQQLPGDQPSSFESGGATLDERTVNRKDQNLVPLSQASRPDYDTSSAESATPPKPSGQLKQASHEPLDAVYAAPRVHDGNFGKEQSRQNNSQSRIENAAAAKTAELAMAAQAQLNLLNLETRQTEEESSTYLYLEHYSSSVLKRIQSVALSARDSLSRMTDLRPGSPTQLSLTDRLLHTMPSDYLLTGIVARLSWQKIYDTRVDTCRAVDRMLEEYDANPASREQIEKNALIMQYNRVRLIRVILDKRPELFQKIAAELILPPGSDTDPIPGVNPRMLPVLEKLQLTSKQLKTLVQAWARYRKESEMRVMELPELDRMDTNSGQLSECGSDLASTSSTQSSSSDMSLQAVTSFTSDEFLSIMKAICLVAGYKEQEATALLRFLARISDTLTVIQRTRLQTVVAPNFIDPIQFGMMLERVSPTLQRTVGDSDSSITEIEAV